MSIFAIFLFKKGKKTFWITLQVALDPDVLNSLPIDSTLLSY